MEIFQSMGLLAELFQCGGQIFTWCYDQKGDLLHSNCPDEAFLSGAFDLFGCKRQMLEHGAVHNTPITLGTALGILWAAAFEKEDGQLKHAWVIGPVFYQNVSLRGIEKGLRYYSRLETSVSWAMHLQEILEKVPVVQNTILHRYTLMMHYCLTGEYLAMSDINSEVSEIQVESWSKLSRIMTHEIMNSLAPITSLSDTLLEIDRPLDPDVKRGLETISATSRRLVNFVENYRRFTRVPAPQCEPFEVRELVRQAVSLASAENDLRIHVDIEPPETMIYADKVLLGQVAVNLLKNAREAIAGRPDGEIEIRSRIDAAEHVIIEFSNNGGAIPPEVAENIFTPFYTTKPDGSGIGLSLSRRIMQLHGGSLRLTCNTDRRVTFTLQIG